MLDSGFGYQKKREPLPWPGTVAKVEEGKKSAEMVLHPLCDGDEGPRHIRERRIHQGRVVWGGGNPDSAGAPLISLPRLPAVDPPPPARQRPSPLFCVFFLSVMGQKSFCAAKRDRHKGQIPGHLLSCLKVEDKRQPHEWAQEIVGAGLRQLVVCCCSTHYS